jgi:hypothetical protein
LALGAVFPAGALRDGRPGRNGACLDVAHELGVVKTSRAKALVIGDTVGALTQRGQFSRLLRRPHKRGSQASRLNGGRASGKKRLHIWAGFVDYPKARHVGLDDSAASSGNGSRGGRSSAESVRNFAVFAAANPACRCSSAPKLGLIKYLRQNSPVARGGSRVCAFPQTARGRPAYYSCFCRAVAEAQTLQEQWGERELGF